MHVEARDRPALEAAGLCDHQQLMRDASLGEPVGARSTRRLRRVEWAGGSGYLKCESAAGIGRQVRALLRLSAAHSGPVAEAHALAAHRAAGIAAARPIAWGERRIGPFACEGCVIVEAVAGEGLRSACRAATASERHRLVRRFGELVGRTHAAGLFTRTRTQDAIVAAEAERATEGDGASGGLWRGGDLVLIDREMPSARPRRFTTRRAIGALRKSWRRAVVADDRFTLRDAAEFARGYLGVVGDRWRIDPRGLIDAVM